METKKANQILLKVTKMRNKTTGKEAFRVHRVLKLDYEFEAEALVDFKFATAEGEEKSNFDAELAKIQQSVLDDSEAGHEVPVSMCGPLTFTHGKTMYSQVKAPFKLPSAALDLFHQK